MTSSGLTATYTTDAETAVQYLGAHEIYWWGYKNYMMVKLADGVSFKMFLVASDFDTVAAISSGS